MDGRTLDSFARAIASDRIFGTKANLEIGTMRLIVMGLSAALLVTGVAAAQSDTTKYEKVWTATIIGVSG